MTDRELRMMKKMGLSVNDFKPQKKEPSTVTISREDFDLLDIEQDVMYHIIEEDGTITMKKGVNR